MSQDIRVMVPRVRRALRVGPETLSDEQVKDLIADALGALILYSGSAFGRTLTATEVDPDSGEPTEYEIDPDLPLPEQTAVGAQAALDYFFHEFSGTKTMERISDEAQTWEWQTSAQMLRDRMKLLVDERDRALDAISSQGAALDSYVSYLHVHTRHTYELLDCFGGQERLGLYS